MSSYIPFFHIFSCHLNLSLKINQWFLKSKLYRWYIIINFFLMQDLHKGITPFLYFNLKLNNWVIPLFKTAIGLINAAFNLMLWCLENYQVNIIFWVLGKNVPITSHVWDSRLTAMLLSPITMAKKECKFWNSLQLQINRKICHYISLYHESFINQVMFSNIMCSML